MASCNNLPFDCAFKKLTGHAPFPWQAALYERFQQSHDGRPLCCPVPTGLGKTAVLAVWLIALAGGAEVPQRLVYIVNRRTVVDQTTREAERLRANAPRIGVENLAISTLRGQYADNREWSADPSRPAIICGTVDMIGSRLLFSGYGVGYKGRPLHAGFLGQDALLVHDEAHLEPAFQALIESIASEQQHCKDLPRLQIMQLSATGRSGDDASKVCGLTPEEASPPDLLPDPPTEPIHHVWRRIKAAKRLVLHEVRTDNAAADKIADLAMEHEDSAAAVLVFLRRLNDVEAVCSKLKKKGVDDDRIERLTGTMRGLERDRMADPRREGASRVFARFLRPPGPQPPEGERWAVEPMPGTVYLVCTSAGEVGVDLSADHMVCDLSPLDSIVQRFGRVNRYGDRSDTRIDVAHPSSADPLDHARSATLDLLKLLKHDASPGALSTLMAQLSDSDRKAAFSRAPTILPAADILFDAWALTSIRDRLPGRPHVEPYLRGVREWEPAETHIAWRKEVALLTGDLLVRHPPQDLLDDYPLKPHELLRDTSERVLTHLQAIAKRHRDEPAWRVDDDGLITVHSLTELADPRAAKKSLIGRIAGCTIVLPPAVGGLSGGMLNGEAAPPENGSLDVADEIPDPADPSRLLRVRIIRSDDSNYREGTAGMRLIRSIPMSGESDDAEVTWDWFIRSPEGTRTAPKPVAWESHVDDVVTRVAAIVERLGLNRDIAGALVLAARLHDHGKRRDQFQRNTLGNRMYPEVTWAKGGRRAARLPEVYRHELGSLVDAEGDAEFQRLSQEMQDLVLHLIAAHHGRARPHFAPEEALDPEHPDSVTLPIVCETPRRFARLQRRYGRWGLAYLESILRAADWAASAEPSAFVEEHVRRSMAAEAAR